MVEKALRQHREDYTSTLPVDESSSLLERIEQFGFDIFRLSHDDSQPYSEDVNEVANGEGGCLEMPRSHGG